MTETSGDFDRALHALLDAGPDQMSDRLAKAIATDVHQTPQRGVTSPWRFPHMNRFTTAAAATIIVVAVAGLALVMNGPSRTIGTSPQPTPSVTASASPKLLAPLGYSGAGTIAYVGPDPSISDGAAFLINPDGTRQTPLYVPPLGPGTPAVRGTCCARFSPDGRRIAVAVQETDGAGGADMWTHTKIVSLDGTNGTKVPILCGGCGSTSRVNFAPGAWSPDGRLLAVEVWSDSDSSRNGMNIATTSGDFNQGLWAVGVSGSHRDVPVAFSPDGSHLLFVRLNGDTRSGPLMMLTVPRDIFQTPEPWPERQVTPNGLFVDANGYFGAAASWSPDGSQIAFAVPEPTAGENYRRAYVINAAGGKPAPVTKAAPWITTAQWSPDGSWIAYDEPGDNGGHDLHIVHPDGTGDTDLTASFSPGICCSRWSPDSKALLAAGTDTTDDMSYLFIVPINGQPVRQVTTAPGLYVDFSWGGISR